MLLSIHLYVHRADQALTTLAMRKFCEDKVSSSMQPCQNRWDTDKETFIFSSANTDLSACLFKSSLSSPLFLDMSTTLVVYSRAPSKWTAALCSFTRSLFHPYQTSRLEEVSFAQANNKQLVWFKFSKQCSLCLSLTIFFFFCVGRFLSVLEDLPVFAAGVHFRCLVSTRSPRADLWQMFSVMATVCV